VHITDYFQFIFSMLPPDLSNQPTQKLSSGSEISSTLTDEPSSSLVEYQYKKLYSSGCAQTLDEAINKNSCCVASPTHSTWLMHVVFLQHGHFHKFRKRSSFFSRRLPEKKLLFPGGLPENNLIQKRK
jgi:hypothetical protein